MEHRAAHELEPAASAAAPASAVALHSDFTEAPADVALVHEARAASQAAEEIAAEEAKLYEARQLAEAAATVVVPAPVLAAAAAAAAPSAPSAPTVAVDEHAMASAIAEATKSEENTPVEAKLMEARPESPSAEGKRMTIAAEEALANKITNPNPKPKPNPNPKA